jgi:hypothetical protein
VVGFFFLANLFGPKRPGETWRNTAVLLVSGVAGIGLLIWSMRVGHYRGQWLAGTGLAIAAVVVFGVMMFAGLLLFTRVHWQ